MQNFDALAPASEKSRAFEGKKIPQTKVCGILEIFSLALAVENLEDIVERVGLSFVLCLFLCLFLIEIERGKTGSSLAALLRLTLFLVEVKRTGRNTQGVTFAKPDKGDTILSIARNEEKDEPEDGGDAAANGTAETAQSGENVNNADEA